MKTKQIKLKQMKTKLSNYFSFVVLFLLFHSSYGMELSLKVDHKNHCITVENANGKYQWYKNDKRIALATKSSLYIKESGNYKVEIIDKNGKISSASSTFLITAAATIVKIYTIGDSTVQNYTDGYYPRKGWGQVLPNFFNTANVEIVNKAVGGTSSKSFYNTYWTDVKNALVKGDYVFIQFGINDRTKTDPTRYAPTGGEFEGFLKKFIDETRAKGAFPVLVTTIRRNSWNADNVTVYDAYHDHPIAVRTVAKDMDVPLIDLDAKAKVLMESLGNAYCTRFLYNNYPAGEYPNYPNGITDNVHFQEMGAIEMAKLITKGVSELSSDVNVSKLIPFIRHQYTIGINRVTASKDSLTTRATNYPTGLTITLKTIPKKGGVFQKWSNVSGTQIATKSLTTVTSGNSTSYTCTYNGAAKLADDGLDKIAETEKKLLGIKLSPNPFTTSFVIESTVPNNFSYMIFDIHGKKQEEGSFKSSASVGQNLEKGLYLITVNNGITHETIRVIKK